MIRYIERQAKLNPGLVNYLQEVKSYKRITTKRLEKYRATQREIRRVRKPLGALKLETRLQYEKEFKRLEKQGKFVNRAGNFATKFSPLSVKLNIIDTSKQDQPNEIKLTKDVTSDEARLILNGFFERLFQFGWKEGVTIINDKIIDIIEQYGWNKTAQIVSDMERAGYGVTQALIYNDDGVAEEWNARLMFLIGGSTDEL